MMMRVIVVLYIQVEISRLMKQLSDPAILLAVHTYFPDMLLLRLLSFRVPVFSSKMAFTKKEDNSHVCI